VVGNLPGQLGGTAAPFTCTLLGPDGAEREIGCSAFAVDMAGSLHCVAVFRDLTGSRAAARTAAALAQTAAQLVGAGTTEEILVGIGRHAVEGTRALAVGIIVVGDDHKLTVSGGYGFPDASRSREAWTAGSVTHDDLPGGDVLREVGAGNHRVIRTCMPSTGSTSTAVHRRRTPPCGMRTSPPGSRPVAVLSRCTPRSVHQRPRLLRYFPGCL
jgi:hypothetical protein